MSETCFLVRADSDYNGQSGEMWGPFDDSAAAWQAGAGLAINLMRGAEDVEGNGTWETWEQGDLDDGMRQDQEEILAAYREGDVETVLSLFATYQRVYNDLHEAILVIAPAPLTRLPAPPSV